MSLYKINFTMARINQEDIPAGLMEVMSGVQAYIYKSGLDQKLIKLLQMRVSQINSCAYCMDMHYKEAVHAGEEPVRLLSVSVWRETNYYTPKEQAVLAFAETLTHMPAEQHTHHLHDELLNFFSRQEIAVLTLAVCQINSWNRLVRSFGAEAGTYQLKR